MAIKANGSSGRINKPQNSPAKGALPATTLTHEPKSFATSQS
ncbi:uncharacterized protein METZ01_LOCUS74975 [marine metagenome]|jgi:hypothetical protein|uniref:Uncharacterized protein n=1 Tax=marine metagenome TaxID=408172 RepID=A0A381U2Y6_9ZZZZ